jgi:hypothetical protein
MTTHQYLVNLTAHTIAIRAVEGGLVELQPSGVVARVDYDRPVLTALRLAAKTVNVERRTVGAVRDLPAATEGVLYVVSRALADAVDRTDLLIPGRVTRSVEGVPLFCDRLIHATLRRSPPGSDSCTANAWTEEESTSHAT